MLEGRHPLAMAHYANHPAPGCQPNAIIASFTFRPPGWQRHSSAGSSSSSVQDPRDGSSSGSTGSSDGVQGSSGSSEGEGEAWMRAYVPNIDYSFKCSHQELLTRVGFLPQVWVFGQSGAGFGVSGDSLVGPPARLVRGHATTCRAPHSYPNQPVQASVLLRLFADCCRWSAD